MNEEEIDALSGTSPETETATVEIAQDVPEVTSASGAQADPTLPANEELDAFKADVQKASGEEPSQTESESKSEATTSEKDEPVAVEGEDKGSDDLSQNNKEVPLTERPEWLSATKIADKVGKEAGKEIRGILRNFYKKEYELSQQIEKLKPATEVVQEMFQSVGGNEQGFKNVRHLIRSFDADPKSAVPMLETLLADAKNRAGLVIQSPELLTEAKELDQQVKDGLIEPSAAEKRKQELLEIEQARVTQKRTQQQTEAQRQQKAKADFQQKQQAQVAEITQAAESWEKEKLASDPDYLPLKSLHTSRTLHLAEAKVQKLGRMLTGREAIAIADQALKEVKEEVGKLLPKKTTRMAINGGSSSGNNRQQPMTEFEQFRADVERAVGTRR